jgi:ABC-type proline/glycine betaine transport system permease subunit
MTIRRVLGLTFIALLLPRPCAASDPTGLIAMAIGFPTILLSILALALASFVPRAGFIVSLILLLFSIAALGEWKDGPFYLAIAINVVALLVSIVVGRRKP